MTFSEALAGYPLVFSKLFVALIRTAEESGSMSRTLDYLANSMEKADRLERKVRSMTAYPVFVGVIFFVVAVIMTAFCSAALSKRVFVIRRAIASFDQGRAGDKQCHPAQRCGIHPVPVILVVLVAVYRRSAAGRIVFDHFILGIPFFGGCLRKLAVARFCHNLGIMVSGGVPVASALAITSEVLGNRALEISLKASLIRSSPAPTSRPAWTAKSFRD